VELTSTTFAKVVRSPGQPALAVVKTDPPQDIYLPHDTVETINKQYSGRQKNVIPRPGVRHRQSPRRCARPRCGVGRGRAEPMWQPAAQGRVCDRHVNRQIDASRCGAHRTMRLKKCTNSLIVANISSFDHEYHYHRMPAATQSGLIPDRQASHGGMSTIRAVGRPAASPVPSLGSLQPGRPAAAATIRRVRRR
jgi:hypothetical protein